MSLADRLAKTQQRDRITEVRSRVQEQLVESLGPRLYDATMSDNELEGLVHQRLRELLDEEEGLLSAQEKLLIVRQIGDSVLGLGPLEPFVRDPEVTEIMVNNWDTIYVERAGKLYWTGTKFHDEQQLRRTIDKIVGKVGRRVDEASPYVDARLPDGSRVNAVIPPLAIDGPALTIRKFAADPYGADDLIEFGTMSSATAKFLEACVRGRINVLVAGGTGAGKTTTLNVVSSFIPDDERIVTIEDAAELKLQQPHVVRLESRPPNIEGKGAVTIRSRSEMKLESTLSRVVLPAPVPPLIRQFRRARTQCARKSSIGCVSAFSVTRSPALSRSAGKRRMDRMGPSTASGGMIALTREPSARRASTIGELSSILRPTPLTMRSMTRSRCLSSWNVAVTRSSTPARSTNTFR